MSRTIPAVILGASGYVGGELLRLIAAHPNFDLAAAVSDSLAGTRIDQGFRHLSMAYGADLGPVRLDAIYQRANSG